MTVSVFENSRTAAVVGIAGGGLGAIAAAGYGVLLAEAGLARRIIGQPFGDRAPCADGWFEAPGCDRRANPLRLVVLGDSGAAGLGCEHPWQTPGALLAAGLAQASGRRVRLRTYAAVGAEASDLADQLDRLIADLPVLGGDPGETGSRDPDGRVARTVCALVVGGNDVAGQVRVASSVRHLAEAVTRLREFGFDVVVGTCPDLGTVRPVPQPLRALARRMSRNLASAQTVAAVSAGARTVSLGDLLGPVFDADPENLFSSDRFHPSAAGYARMTEAVLPTVCAAAGFPFAPQAERPRREPAAPVAQAAAEAVERAGSEVAPAGARRRPLTGRLGRWATLRRSSSEPEQTDPSPADLSEQSSNDRSNRTQTGAAVSTNAHSPGSPWQDAPVWETGHPPTLGSTA